MKVPQSLILDLQQLFQGFGHAAASARALLEPTELPLQAERTPVNTQTRAEAQTHLFPAQL